ncbi:MAG: hypothetical protein BGO69_15185 [Bacteroidetes bacterium 46-16]|nr:MAG: hypothetical protein BGO69_15185 [Bacteroidetes bacterium 46-16]
MQTLSYNFHDIVDIIPKNGHFKLNFRNKEANIYRTLRLLGYGRTKIDGKILLYKRDEKGIEPTNITHLRIAFANYLKKCDTKLLPNGLTAEYIFRIYDENPPIKQNDLFAYYLACTLNKEEEEAYKMSTNPNYRQLTHEKYMLQKFAEWQMSKSIDKIGTLLKGSDIFYKKIDNKTYLLFNNHTSNVSGYTYKTFDCFLAKYKNLKEIGSKAPSSLETLILGFKLERDLNLVEKFVY